MTLQYENIQRNVMPPVQVTSPLTGTVFMVLGSGEQRPRTLAFRPGYFDIYDIKGLLISSIPDPRQDAVDVARLAALYDASVRMHYPEEVEMREPLSAPVSSGEVRLGDNSWNHEAVGNVNQRSGLAANWNRHPLAEEYKVYLIDGESNELITWTTASQVHKDNRRFVYQLSYHQLRRVPRRAMLKVLPMVGDKTIAGVKAYIELSQNPDL